MNDEEQLREFIRESFISEGMMDWLFSRWRKGGRWVGQAGKALAGMQDSYSTLQKMHSEIGKMQKDYPRATKRIRGNIKRVLLDLEQINMMVNKGVSEKNFLKQELDE